MTSPTGSSDTCTRGFGIAARLNPRMEAGASDRETGEVIWQMSLAGGFLAAITRVNAALEVFEESKS